MKKTNYLLLRHTLRSISIIAVSTCCLHGATFTVTTTNISGPGSLPVAIVQANTTPGKNKILFAVTNIITLGSQLPAITNSMTIMGRTDVPTVISGGGVLPIFVFVAGTTNTMSNLVLANGSTTGSGAAISNTSSLSVNNCTITNHSAASGSGGAIINSGIMTIMSSTISSGSAASGGAIYNTAALTLLNSQLANNQAGIGGAIYNAGLINIQNLTVVSNQATLGSGGGIYNAGTLVANGSAFSSNHAIGTAGQNGQNGQFAYENSSDGNDWFGSGGGGGGGGSAGAGGGLFSASGSICLTNCTLTGNQSIGGIGGNGGLGGSITFGSLSTAQGGNGGGGAGAGGGTGGTGGQWNNPYPYPFYVGAFPTAGTDGGVWSGGGGGGGGTVIVYAGGDRGGVQVGHAGGQSGFGGGHGGMGGGGSGWSALQFSVQGEAGYGGNGGSGLGSGIFIESGSALIVYCTVISNNTVAGSPGSGSNLQPSLSMGGMPGSGMGGGIFQHFGSVTLLGTIIAGNSAKDNGADLNGIVSSVGYNLIGNNQGATNLSIFDFQNVTANIGPLQDNGGPTLTCAPFYGSLAIGNGTSAGAPKTDQRGVPRPQSGAFDIGAVQAVTGSPLVTGAAAVKGSGFTLNTIFDATNSYRVQASTNLTAWVNLSTNASGGPLHFIDTAATNLNRRFYRTATP